MKFRSRSKGTKTENLAGGEAFKQTAELELASLLLTSFVKDKFYESADAQVERLANLVKSLPDKKFAAQAAIYARNEFGMRSITHALAGELVYNVKGEDWTKNAISRIVKRPDDMLEIVGYYGQKYGKPFPNALKKGLALAVDRFDAYSLAKYKSSRADVKMVDLFNLVHPKSEDSNKQSAYKKLMAGDLKSFDTWEANLTKAGQDVAGIENAEEKEEKLKELKGNVWKELLTENKLGYFALLRNLRNILKQAPELEELACEKLVDAEAIKKSLVMPFRYLSALEALNEASLSSRKVIAAISTALEISLSNVPHFDGKTLVVLDTSGSMNGKPIRIGALFAAVLYKSNDAELMTFDTSARYWNVNPNDSATTIAAHLVDNAHGGGTDFDSIFQTAHKKYDRIVILSDMQGWVGYDAPTRTFDAYKAITGANPFIYSFDLAGYGTLEFPQDKVFCLAGFSDKVFDIMNLAEAGRDALVNKIKSVIIV